MFELPGSRGHGGAQVSGTARPACKIKISFVYFTRTTIQREQFFFTSIVQLTLVGQIKQSFMVKYVILEKNHFWMKSIAFKITHGNYISAAKTVQRFCKKIILTMKKYRMESQYCIVPGLSDDEVSRVGRVAAAARGGGGRGVQRLLLLLLLRLLLLLLLLLQVVLRDHAEGVGRRRRVRGGHGGGVVVVLEKKNKEKN